MGQIDYGGDYDDYETPSVYSENFRVARKYHRCSECGRAILSGQRYKTTFGVWVGDAKSYKTCPSCISILDLVQSKYANFSWALGDLISEVRDMAPNFPADPGQMFKLGRYLVGSPRMKKSRDNFKEGRRLYLEKQKQK